MRIRGIQISKVCGITFCLFAVISSCNTVKRANHTLDTSSSDEEASTPILVFGDIQQKDEFLLKDPGLFDQAQWDNHRIDASALAALNPQALVPINQHADIIQVGDLVDLNNGFEISMQNTGGTQTTLKPRYDEWKTVLGFFPETHFYPTVGNHETYKLIRFHGTKSGSGSFQITAGPNPSAGDITFNSDQDRYNLLTTHFASLKNEATFFKSQSGTYFVNNDNYCLLSIDGAAVVSKMAAIAGPAWLGLKPFIETSLATCSTHEGDRWIPKKPSIVTIHYPIFSALAFGNQEFLDEIAAEVVKVFNEYRVALVLSGHEHLYMRYRDQGYIDAGYSAFLPLQSTYVTIANFGVPAVEGNSLKLRGIGKTPAQNKPTRVSFSPAYSLGSKAEGNGTKFFLAEEPTVALLRVSKHLVEFTAKRRVGSSWLPFDWFTLRLSPDGTWSRTEGTVP